MKIGKLEGDLDKHVELIAIYSGFINSAILLDEDRAKLKKDRGFDDDLIDLLKFKSARPENAEIIKTIQANIGDQPLLDSGLLIRDVDGVVKPSFQLIQPNIIIPYLNDNRDIYFIRPHKFGLENIPIQIYAPVRNFDAGTLIIAESEFKAVAAMRFGFNSIGIPGISSFSKNNYPRLLDFINKYSGINKIVIIFDNEIKDDISLPNYKPDPLKQWDTPWRAIQLAKNLYKDLLMTKPVLIGELPNAWRVNGKIDIDGALAQKRTKEEFKEVVDNAYIPDKYLSVIPSAGQRVVKRKLIKEQDDNPIIRKVGGLETGYYVKEEIKSKSKDEPSTFIEKKLSNFVIEIRKTVVEGSSGIRTREVYIYGADGTVSGPHWFNPSDYDLRDFRQWAFGRGDFRFSGNMDQLMLVFELECATSDFRIIKRYNNIGYIKDEPPFWLFGNCLIKAKGQILEPDETGIIWDGLDGYQPRSIRESIDTNSKENSSSAKMPLLNIDKSISFGHTDLKNMIDKMVSNFDNQWIRLAIGWLISVAFSDEIFKKFGSFPILFIGGKRESGKTTLVNYLMACAGFSDIAGDPLGPTSPAGVARNLAWYKNLPYWLDEYRNNKKIKEWDGYFRNIYQRQASSKGTLTSKVRFDEVNAGLILSGEETPEDNALLSRCIIINLTKNDREAKHHIFKELEELKNSGLMSRLMVEVLAKKDQLLPKILNDISLWKDTITKYKDDAGALTAGPRVALNIANACACYARLFLSNDVKESIKFRDWVLKESVITEKEKEDEHMLNIFWDDLPTLAEEIKEFYSIFEDPLAIKGKRKIALHFRSFYSKWNESSRRKGNEPFKGLTMLSYIKEESYYISHDTPRKIGPLNKQYRCLIISLDTKDNPPPGLLTLADGVIASPESPVGQAGTSADALF